MLVALEASSATSTASGAPAATRKPSGAGADLMMSAPANHKQQHLAIAAAMQAAPVRYTVYFLCTPTEPKTTMFLVVHD